MPPGQDQVSSLNVLSFIQLVKACYVQSLVIGTKSTAVDKTGKSDTNASKKNSSAEGGGANLIKMCPAQGRVKAAKFRMT